MLPEQLIKITSLSPKNHVLNLLYFLEGGGRERSVVSVPAVVFSPVVFSAGGAVVALVSPQVSVPGMVVGRASVVPSPAVVVATVVSVPLVPAVTESAAASPRRVEA